MKEQRNWDRDLRQLGIIAKIAIGLLIAAAALDIAVAVLLVIQHS